MKSKPLSPKPPWLKRRLPSGPVYEQMRGLLTGCGLHTVCQEAACPNIWECFSRKTATFLILGNRCTRNCRFCAVGHGPPQPPDPEEPGRVARAARRMNLRYAVITSVTRDDLEDGGASRFADTMEALRSEIPGIRLEVLTPDFMGDARAVKRVVSSRPEVFNHNMETVPRLYPDVRPQADYRRSLEVLNAARENSPKPVIKSGIMVGLGESEQELDAVFRDLLDAGCNILTIGQYLRPSNEHLAVRRFVSPETFRHMKARALDMGFAAVEAGPFVRSSFNAEALFEQSA